MTAHADAPTARTEPAMAHEEGHAALADIVRGALEWVTAHRDRFALPPDVLETHTDLNWSMKPLGELARLSTSITRAAHTVADHRDDPHWRQLAEIARELLDFTWSEIGEGRVLRELARLEPHATYPLEIYAAFASAGLRDERFEEFTGTLVRTRAWASTEQQPNRRLGVLAAEHQARLPSHDDPTEALRRTWLGALPEPWTFDVTAGYALTHTVFHLTDWGARPAGVPADLDTYLHHWLPCWLDSCLEDQQWDLGCELLAVGASLPEPYPPDRHLPVWREVAGRRAPDGSLHEVGAEPPDAFAHRYHSTLAAAFAAALTAASTTRSRPSESAHRDAHPGHPGHPAHAGAHR
ncbi:hypothetical protein H3146_24090 [Streptomyces sp. OF3]|uniref:DUF6895 domain-containing protein n=1 Tax=Streptomyces alkaliterrae TaxID=2213162 RepID=A0A7W3WQQ8_9ACTN|nr:hypothetical protein [Streptomyces alkaliterrae]MBB1256410.1 hypothetical protein [Streptomyces alkaliterrae]